jgi:hypothetical protein
MVAHETNGERRNRQRPPKKRRTSPGWTISRLADSQRGPIPHPVLGQFRPVVRTPGRSRTDLAGRSPGPFEIPPWLALLPPGPPPAPRPHPSHGIRHSRPPALACRFATSTIPGGRSVEISRPLSPISRAAANPVSPVPAPSSRMVWPGRGSSRASIQFVIPWENSRRYSRRRSQPGAMASHSMSAARRTWSSL